MMFKGMCHAAISSLFDQKKLVLKGHAQALLLLLGEGVCPPGNERDLPRLAPLIGRKLNLELFRTAGWSGFARYLPRRHTAFRFDVHPGPVYEFAGQVPLMASDHGGFGFRWPKDAKPSAETM
jgi:hypothetical protein